MSEKNEICQNRKTPVPRFQGREIPTMHLQPYSEEILDEIIQLGVSLGVAIR